MEYDKRKRGDILAEFPLPVCSEVIPFMPTHFANVFLPLCNFNPQNLKLDLEHKGDKSAHSPLSLMKREAIVSFLTTAPVLGLAAIKNSDRKNFSKIN